jgi:hypothetical protein
MATTSNVGFGGGGGFGGGAGADATGSSYTSPRFGGGGGFGGGAGANATGSSYTYRGGRYGGGGGNQARAEDEALKKQNEAKAKAEAERKARQEEAKKKFEAEQKARKEKAFGQTTTGQVKLGYGGAVTIGGNKYVGNAYIKSLGMTANEYNRKIRDEAVSSGQISKADYGRSSFVVTYEQQEVPSDSTMQSNQVSGMFGGGGSFGGSGAGADATGSAYIKGNSFGSKISMSYNRANKFIKNKITDPYIFNPAEKYLGLNATTFGTGLKQAVQMPLVVVSGKTSILNSNDPVSSAVEGFGSGIYQDVKDNPAKQLVLFGAGKVIGLGAEAVGSGLTAIPKVGRVLGSTFRGAEIIGGAGVGGYYAYKTGTEVVSSAKSGDYKEVGSKTGIAIKDLFIFGKGYSSGKKSYQSVQDSIRTFGRTELPTKDVVPYDVLIGKKKFVENPSGKINAKEYLKLFNEKSQIIPGIKEPMAYHQAPSTFWGKSNLQVTDGGTSEFLGLYGAYRPSPYFLKVGGSSSTGLSVKGVIANILQPYGKPGTAGIIPERFVIGKSAKVGEAFIPAIKPEVEAIFPVGTQASMINKKFFYTWEGRKIPIDIFKVSKGKVEGEVPLGDVLSSSSYSKPSSYNPVVRSSLSKGSKTSSSYDINPSEYYKSGYGKSNNILYSASSTTSYKRGSYKGGSSSSIVPSYKPSVIIDSYKSSKKSSKSIIGKSYVSSKTSLVRGSRFNRPTIIQTIPFKDKPLTSKMIKPSRTAYQPSFTGSVLNIRASRKPLLAGSLSVRPILVSGKRKKKKRLWWM